MLNFGFNPTQSGEIVESLIANGAITNTKIENGAVTENKISSNAVTNTKIENGAVTEDKISSNAVTNTKIENGAVTETKLASNAVTTSKAVMATQAQAIAGTSDSVFMSAVRTKEAIEALSLFTKSYESSEQTISQAGSLTLTHNLGKKPKLLRAVLVCKTAEKGYSVGDELEVNLGQMTTDALKNFALKTTTTQILIKYRNVGLVFGGVDFSNGNVVLGFNNAYWRLKIYAYA